MEHAGEMESSFLDIIMVVRESPWSMLVRWRAASCWCQEEAYGVAVASNQ